MAGLRSRIEVHLSFWDRVRVLFGAPMVVYYEADTEPEVQTITHSSSDVQIGRPKAAETASAS